MIIDRAPLLDLLQACLDSKAEWNEFIGAAKPVIQAAVAHTLRPWRTPTAGEIEDLTQDVFVALCAGDFDRLRHFRAERPEALHAYLRTIAASVAIDSLRASLAQKRGSGRLSQLPDEPSGMASYSAEENISRTILLEQVDRCLKRNPEVKDRDRWIFWMYYRDGLTARSISAIRALQLTQKGVESIIQRMVRHARECVEKRRAAEGKTAQSPI
ncbi:MAG TPA: sigma-70 family RNA polymerase sigma factor [Bryobacteraceae bacterium]|nr:sigma-70 family RNA polymerase sigma factor [Bryobacteraceae bacterium]